ncbi:uncharacterized protein PSFLO_00095 [Pseudozyma flocculosa]|uniref:Uncharacterized protein n=1 Tax=Pseudozyma flocculosa TaxID=84751 RepID=A0A5C3EQI3_9BASI|nr:uncharacterized protein PSFLO_00095 [Pseudozyma flocculosa]
MLCLTRGLRHGPAACHRARGNKSGRVEKERPRDRQGPARHAGFVGADLTARPAMVGRVNIFSRETMAGKPMPGPSPLRNLQRPRPAFIALRSSVSYADTQMPTSTTISD